MESIHIVVEDVLTHEEDLDDYLKQTKDEITSKTKELEAIVSERYFDIISLASNLVHLSSDLENYELRLIAPNPFKFEYFEERDILHTWSDKAWDKLNSDQVYDALMICLDGIRNNDKECEDILIYLSDVEIFDLFNTEQVREWLVVYAVMVNEYDKLQHLVKDTIGKFVRNTVEFSLNEVLVYKIKQVLHGLTPEDSLPKLKKLLSDLEYLLTSSLTSEQLNSFLQSKSSTLRLNFSASHISLILQDLESELQHIKLAVSDLILSTKDISSIQLYLIDSQATYFSLWNLIKDVWIDRTLSLISTCVLDSLSINAGCELNVSKILNKFEFDVSEITVLLQKIQFENSFRSKISEYLKNTVEELNEMYCKDMNSIDVHELLCRAGVGLMLPTTQLYKGNV